MEGADERVRARRVVRREREIRGRSARQSRDFISCAALLVKVTARIFSGTDAAPYERGNPLDDDARLACAGARQYQKRPVFVEYGRTLRFIQLPRALRGTIANPIYFSTTPFGLPSPSVSTGVSSLTGSSGGIVALISKCWRSSWRTISPSTYCTPWRFCADIVDMRRSGHDQVSMSVASQFDALIRSHDVTVRINLVNHDEGMRITFHVGLPGTGDPSMHPWYSSRPELQR